MPTDIKEILQEREKRYGDFIRHAEITQHLQNLIFAYRDKDDFEYDQVEALEMICHKLGRIVNGDPDYADSWVDIAGYAKLVADRLEKSDAKNKSESVSDINKSTPVTDQEKVCVRLRREAYRRQWGREWL